MKIWFFHYPKCLNPQKDADDPVDDSEDDSSDEEDETADLLAELNKVNSLD